MIPQWATTFRQLLYDFEVQLVYESQDNIYLSFLLVFTYWDNLIS